MVRLPPKVRREPLTPIERVFLPFERFVRAEAFGGVLLVLCTVAALVWANSPAGGSYEALWQTPAGFRFGGFELFKPLILWINDGLMAIFFFVVGLEIKRELLAGELSSPRQAALPVAAALGGMVAPALLYVAFNHGGEGAGGWGVPMATDIAFALGILSLMGSRVPLSLKVFLTALAIADDLGAVLVIALFYTHGVNVAALGAAAGILAVLVVLNLSGVRSPIPYILVGLGLWVAFLKSGIHPTVAGVLLAALIPARSRIPPEAFVDESRTIVEDFEAAAAPETQVLGSKARQGGLMALEEAIHKARPPLQRIEQFLHPWVSYGIMPLFALANAGVDVGGAGLASLGKPIALGILAGLVLGKPLGIVGASWLVVRLGAADMPPGASWRKLWGVGCLAGIGFTMSLFIAGLAFDGTGHLAEAKMGILVASLASALAGWAVLSGSGITRDEPKG